MRYRKLPKNALRIISEEGIGAFIRKFSRWVVMQSGLAYLSTIVQLMRSGRSYRDATWLLGHKPDRQDALLNLNPTWNLYHDYTSRRSHQVRYEFAAQQLAEFADSDSIDVLDVASGTGYGCEILESESDRVVNHYGCEINSRTITYSRNYYKSNYVQANVETLPFEDDVFEGIVSLETMEHIPDLDRYFAELMRVSTDHSKLIISTPYDEELDLKKEKVKKEYPHRHTFDFESLTSLLEGHFPDASIDYHIQSRHSVTEFTGGNRKSEEESEVNECEYFLITICK